MVKEEKVICFDLEGPLSPQDNAYEVMGLIPEGHRIFEVISRYDDLLVLEGKEGYEPGDTLYLILPFLIAHRITEKDIREISNKAKLVKGAEELMWDLQNEGWEVYIISTSYEQHAFNIAEQVGVSMREKVACTSLPMARFQKIVRPGDIVLIDEAERFILENLYSDQITTRDKEIKEYLNELYWKELRKKPWKEIFQEVTVMGGRRKVRAVEGAVRKHGVYLSQVVVVGDSITDYRMLQAVEVAGGLAIVFNGNEYALPYGTVGVATRDIKNIWNILEIWQAGGREKLKNFVLESEIEQGDDSDPCYHWLLERKQEMFLYILKTHKKFRKLVRGDAAKLG